MPERGVEHATAAVAARPGERPSPGMPMHVGAREIDRDRSEAQQDARAGRVEIADLVDPAVPFDSKQWPMRITPGPGPASLADLP